MVAPSGPRPRPRRQAVDPARPQAIRLSPVRLKRPQLTGRTIMITAMALFLVVVLASPLQTYLNRRDAVASSIHQQQQLNQQVAQLQHQSDQWNDPAFVEREARVRLQYVHPGDTLYTVLNADGTPKSTSKASSSSVTRTGHMPSWNSTLWASVQDAEHAK